MDATRLAQLDETLLARANAVLTQRGRAYASDEDRFKNFKEIGARAGITPLQTCHIFLQKGMAVLDKLAQGREIEGEDVIDRFADALNYIRLMWGLYVECVETGACGTPTRGHGHYVGEKPPAITSAHDVIARTLDHQ